MYAFSKVNLIERSRQKRHAQNISVPHIPNEVLLLTFDSHIIDPLNMEEWLRYWCQHIKETFRHNLVFPKPSSPIIKSAKTQLKRQEMNRLVTNLKYDVIDPHTLALANFQDLKLEYKSKNAEPPRKEVNNTIRDNPILSLMESSYASTSSPPSSTPRKTNRRRQPTEEIQQLMTHVAAISTNCAQAYGKCQHLTESVASESMHNDNTTPTNNNNNNNNNNDISELQPETLLINVLAHQIGGLDVSLSSSMGKSCKLFIQGISEITDTIDFVCDIRHTFFEPLNEQEINHYRILTKDIVRCLDKVNTIISFDVNLKYYFIKLQMEALLCITWKIGSECFNNAIRSLSRTAKILLKELEEQPDFIDGDFSWEQQDEFLRDQYFTVMDKFYFEKRRFSNQYNKTDLLDKLNYHSDWLNHLHRKFSTNKDGSQGAASSNKHHTSSSKKHCGKSFEETEQNETDYTTNKNNSELQRYRNSADLIIDLTNHLLHINNYRTKFIRLSMIDASNGEKSKAPGENLSNKLLKPDESCKLLINILRHQMCGLDIALSSEIFNSIKCFLHGLYDTSCSIMNVMSHKYYDSETGNHLPLPKSCYDDDGDFDQNIEQDDNFYENQHNGSGDGDQAKSDRQNTLQQLLKSLKMTKMLIQQQPGMWKYFILKLQFEALILLHCTPHTDLFRKHLELMAGSAEHCYKMLNHQWFLTCFSISWDKAQQVDQHLFYTYWEVMENRFNDCDRQ